MTRLGDNIKTQRMRLGITQSEFGKLFNVSKQTVSAWEKGLNEPDVDTLIAIADYCVIPICGLIGYPPPNNKTSDLCDTCADERTTYSTVTDKDCRIINKIRSLSKERQKAVEILLGIREE